MFKKPAHSIICLAFLSFFVSTGIQAGTQNNTLKLPDEALQILQELPDRSVSLEFVIARALQSSSGFKTLAAQYISHDSAQLEALSALDTQVSLFGSLQNNQNQQASAFSPSNMNSQLGGLKASKRFQSATELSFEWSLSKNSFDMPDLQSPNPINTEYFESKTSLSLGQNLWQDAFGRSTRKAIRAAEHMGRAQRELVTSQLEEWAYGLTQLFYQAWLAKENALASRESLRRKQRLFQVTQSKMRRGTSEEQDLIQVEGLVLNAQGSLNDAEAHLNHLWRSLVITLDLPHSLIDIDPTLIPIKINDPSSEALQICTQFRDNQVNQILLLSNSKFIQTQQQNNASQLMLEVEKDRFRPRFIAAAQISGNSIDENSQSTALKESFAMNNPSWGAQLSISLPLESRRERAQYQRAFAQNVSAQAAQNSALEELKINALNQCELLSRNQQLARDYRSLLSKQNRRQNIEEQRFDQGRSPLMNVIQAGDDATMTEIKYKSTLAQQHLAAWNIKKIAGHTRKLVERYEQNH